MKKHLVFFFFLFLPFVLPAQSMIISFQEWMDGEIYSGNIGYYNLATCEIDTFRRTVAVHFDDVAYLQPETGAVTLDWDTIFHINIHFFDTLFFNNLPPGIGKLMWPYSINPAFPEEVYDSLAVAMTGSPQGLYYVAGTDLKTYDPPPGFDEVPYFIEDLGPLPPDMQAGGDLTWRLDKLYLTTLNNTVVEVDTANPLNSQVVWTLPPDVPLVSALGTFSYRCDSIVTYAVAKTPDGSMFYQMDFDNQTLTPVCESEMLIFGAATHSEAELPPCALTVDLDADDSFGPGGYDFAPDTACRAPFPICDTDVRARQPIPVDSIRVVLSAPPDGDLEYLTLDPLPPGLQLSGAGTDTLTLINGGGAASALFEEALRNIRYENDSPVVTFGTRAVAVITYAWVYESDPAYAYLTLGNDHLQPGAAFTLPTCHGDSDGAIALSPGGTTGPYTVEWAGGQSAEQLSNLSAGAYALTLTDGEGCARKDTLFLPQPDSLAAVILAEAAAFCGPSGALAASQEGGTAPYDYAWSGALSSGDSLLTGLAGGTYDLLVTDANGCTALASVTLTSYDTLYSNQSETLCAGESFAYQGQTYTADTSFCAAFTALSTGCDSIHCVELTFLDTVRVEESHTICAGDTYELDGLSLTRDTSLCLTYTAANGCDSTYCLTLTVPAPQSEQSETICEGESYFFHGRPLTSPGLYTDTLTAAGGCDSLVRLQLDMLPAPTPAITAEGNLCGSGSVLLTAAGGAAYGWSTGESGATLTASGPGWYVVTVTDAAGCTAVDSIELREESLAIDFQAEPPACRGEASGRIAVADVANARPPLRYALDGRPPGPDSIFTGLAAGVYTLRVEDDAGCVAEVEVTLADPPALYLELGADRTLYFGDSLLLDPSTNALPGQTRWTPAEGLACDTCLTTWARPLRTTRYRVAVTDPAGCSVSDELEVLVLRRAGIYVPNAFSPNGDGVNDRFAVFTDASVRRIAFLRVFDRWGGLVYEAENLPANTPGEGWDGRRGAGEAAPGVYLYQLQVEYVDGRTEVVGGEVSLLR